MKSITEVLKSSCREAHSKTEKTLAGKLKAINNTDDYIEILKMFYGYLSPLEALIEKIITTNELPDIRKRKRSAFIISDLQKLHYQKPLSIIEDLPVVSNLQQAAGVMYVLEGSTLGGQFIVQMLLALPALKEHKDAMAFFRGYEQENFYMWDVFKRYLQANVQNQEDIDIVVHSAIETFSLLDKCILKIKNGRN